VTKPYSNGRRILTTVTNAVCFAIQLKLKRLLHDLRRVFGGPVSGQRSSLEWSRPDLRTNVATAGVIFGTRGEFCDFRQ